jgi:hypothetical protein
MQGNAWWRFDSNHFWGMMPTVETQLGKDNVEVEAKTNEEECTDGEAILPDITGRCDL